MDSKVAPKIIQPQKLNNKGQEISKGFFSCLQILHKANRVFGRYLTIDSEKWLKEKIKVIT